MYAPFLKLLNMSAAGSVLILAVMLLRVLLKKAPRWIPCALWALVALRLVCPVAIASPLSVFRAAPAIVSQEGEVEVFRPAGGSEKPMLSLDTVQIERSRAGTDPVMEIPGTSLTITERSRDAYLPPLVRVYLLGVSALLLYAVISTLLLRRRVSASLLLEGNVRVCDAVPSPFILGLFRPRIYLPSSLDGEERELVLAHERAHIRRLDHVWKPLGFLILSFHWFNPLCWLAYALLCRDIELACDEKVIRTLGDARRAAYSQTLLNCSARRLLTACPVAFGETGVKTRVRAVLSYKKPAFWLLIAAAAGVIVLIACFASDPLPREPDLSFLNYENAVAILAEMDTDRTAVRISPGTGAMVPGTADSASLARFLDNARWTKRRAPSSSPEPADSLEFLIYEDYRILLYAEPRLAAVRFGDEIRYYRTASGDYETALSLFVPAPSTAPDPPPAKEITAFDPEEYLPRYQSVLDRYRAALAAGDTDSMGNVSGLIRNFFGEDALSRVGWSLQDLNFDGVPELLIGCVDNEEFYGPILFDVYTLSEGEPVRLCQSTERDRWYDLASQLLLEESSGGASRSTWTVWSTEWGEPAFYDGVILEDGNYTAMSWENGVTVPGRELGREEAEYWIDHFESSIFRRPFTAFGAGAPAPAVPELWGADALRQYYFEKAEADTDHDYSHMDLSVLSGIASGTRGTVADTEELTIDVVGALITGNTAEIVLRVTAKELDSLLYDNGNPALKNYRFGDATALFLRQTFGNSDCTIDFWYTYSEDDSRLVANQLELHYLLHYQEPIDSDRCTIPLTDFGYYDPASPGFVTRYKDTWTVEIALDPADDYDRRIPLGEDVSVGEYRFSVDSALVSPLACTFLLACEEDEEVVSEHMDELFRMCSEGRDTISLTLADGTVLGAGELLSAGGGGAMQVPLVLSYTLSYRGPMDPDDIRSLSLFGSTFSLEGE